MNIWRLSLIASILWCTNQKYQELKASFTHQLSRYMISRGSHLHMTEIESQIADRFGFGATHNCVNIAAHKVKSRSNSPSWEHFTKIYLQVYSRLSRHQSLCWMKEVLLFQLYDVYLCHYSLNGRFFLACIQLSRFLLRSSHFTVGKFDTIYSQ